MILASIVFPKQIEFEEEQKIKYLNQLKADSLKAWNLVRIGNNLNLQTIRKRLKLIEVYLEMVLDTKIQVNRLIPFILNNIKYDSVSKYITIDSDLKLGKYKIESLIRLLEFGNTQVKGSNIIQYCLETGHKMSLVHIFLLKWGIK